MIVTALTVCETAFIVLALSAIGWAGSYVPVRGSGGKTRWWKLRPSSSNANAQGLISAMATLGKRRRASVTFVRRGEKGNTASLWVGVTNAPEPEKSAQVIASAGGCKLDSEAKPPAPAPDRPWRWWVSSPWVENRASRNRVSSPRQGNKPAWFANHANQLLDPGDLLVITAKPSKDGSTVRAAGMSTRETMASSWCRPTPKARPIRPHPSWPFFSVAGPLSGMVVLIFKWFSSPQHPIEYAVIAVLAIAIAVLGIRSAWRNRPLARRMMRKGPVPVPGKKGRLISRLRKHSPQWLPAPIPTSQIAAWMYI